MNEYTGTKATTRDVIECLSDIKRSMQYDLDNYYTKRMAMRIGAIDLAIDTIADEYEMGDVIHFEVPKGD